MPRGCRSGSIETFPELIPTVVPTVGFGTECDVIGGAANATGIGGDGCFDAPAMPVRPNTISDCLSHSTVMNKTHLTDA